MVQNANFNIGVRSNHGFSNSDLYFLINHDDEITSANMRRNVILDEINRLQAQFRNINPSYVLSTISDILAYQFHGLINYSNGLFLNINP